MGRLSTVSQSSSFSPPSRCAVSSAADKTRCRRITLAVRIRNRYGIGRATENHLCMQWPPRDFPMCRTGRTFLWLATFAPQAGAAAARSVGIGELESEENEPYE